MNKQMTNNDILLLGREMGFDYSETELKSLSAHIRKQLAAFETLSGVNTDGVEPTFDPEGKGRFKIERSGE